MIPRFRARYAIAPVALAGALLFPVPLASQPHPWESTTFEVAAHGGGLRFDVEGLEPTLGGRLGVHLGGGLGFGIALDWASRDQEFEDQTEKADTWLYAAEARYTFPSATRANFFAFGGVGAARFEPGLLEEAADAEAVTELLVPLGLGMLWYNHPGEPWWALRLEFRDNIIFLEEDPEFGREDDAVTNNYALALGVAVLLGGGP